MILANAGTTVAGVFLLIFLVAAALTLYFVPTIVAGVRHHHQVVAIGALNLLLGWTFLGWLGALIWSLTNPPPPQTVTWTQPPEPRR